MKYMVKPVGLPPELHEDEKINLRTLQHYVEGTVTCPHIPSLAEHGVTLWANDDGLCLRMQPNVGLMFGEYPMVLVGPLMFTSVNDEGDTIGLTDTQIEITKAFCEKGQRDLFAVLIASRIAR